MLDEPPQPYCAPMRAVLTALFLLTATLTPCAARAGAWPRDAGSGFFSVATRLSWPQEIAQWTSIEPTEDYHTLYIEYGMTDRLTLGLDVGRSVSGGGKSVAFVQFPLLDRDTGPKVSAQLGFGTIAGENILRPGLSVGWGMPNGWLAFDGVAEMHRSGDTDVKLDVTWGRNLPKGRKLIVQLQTGLQENDPAFARLAPSLVFPMRKKMNAELGATYGLKGDDSMGLKFGLWLDF